MIEGLTGQTFDPSLSLYGMLRAERDRERLTQDRDRFDRLLRERETQWHIGEDDPDRAAALVEHRDAAIRDGGAK